MDCNNFSLYRAGSAALSVVHRVGGVPASLGVNAKPWQVDIDAGGEKERTPLSGSRMMNPEWLYAAGVPRPAFSRLAAVSILMLNAIDQWDKEI
jgi:hypothetical protein